MSAGSKLNNKKHLHAGEQTARTISAGSEQYEQGMALTHLWAEQEPERSAKSK